MRHCISLCLTAEGVIGRQELPIQKHCGFGVCGDPKVEAVVMLPPPELCSWQLRSPLVLVFKTSCLLIRAITKAR